MGQGHRAPWPYLATCPHSFSLPRAGSVFHTQFRALPTTHAADPKHHQTVQAAALGRASGGPQVGPGTSPQLTLLSTGFIAIQDVPLSNGRLGLPQSPLCQTAQLLSGACL